MARVLEDEDLMPFGKHKDVPLIDLPVSYLVWILDECNPGNVKDWAKRNEKWIRAEAASGNRSRPKNKPKEIKPQPPNKLTAIDFVKQELGIDVNTDTTDLSLDGITFHQIVRIAERYKNYFNGTPNLIPLPKREIVEKETPLGWGDEPVSYPSHDQPF